MISSDDPVRVFQDFAEVDLLSNGRAGIMAGRGSFTESFPLFGYDLNDYDQLFDEKLRLLMQLRGPSDRVDGAVPRSARRPGRLPATAAGPAPDLGGGGGAPESAFRAGTLGLPMAIAIIGGMPERFAPFAQLHRDAAAQAGHDPLPAISINSHGFIADTTQEAIEVSWPSVSTVMNRIGRERGWQPMKLEDYVASTTLRGANFVGTPDQVIEKRVPIRHLRARPLHDPVQRRLDPP